MRELKLEELQEVNGGFWASWSDIIADFDTYHYGLKGSQGRP